MSEDNKKDNYDEERGRQQFEEKMKWARKVFEEYKIKSDPKQED